MLPPPEPAAGPNDPREREQEERRRQMLRLLAEIEKRINEENARPKKRYISPATREEVYALYYDALRRRIEERGTRDFPEHQGKKLYGELIMNITVDAVGHVVEAEVVQSSSSQLLDRRAIAIVHAASPFGDFTQAMRRNADQIVVTSRFRFTREDGFETIVERASMSARPDRYAVLGNPVAHSRSPFIHAEFARQTGQAVEYGRVLCPLDGFEAAVRTFAAEGARGCNVTVPFKFDAPRLATPRERSRRAGAARPTCCGSTPTAGRPTTPTASAS